MAYRSFIDKLGEIRKAIAELQKEEQELSDLILRFDKPEILGDSWLAKTNERMDFDVTLAKTMLTDTQLELCESFIPYIELLPKR